MLNFTALALAAAQTAQPSPPPAGGRYECRAETQTGGWLVVDSTHFADGGFYSAFGSWYDEDGSGRQTLSIQWRLTANLGVERVYVNIVVPIRATLEGTKILSLHKGDSYPGMMALSATAARGPIERQAAAAVDLQTLLAYAGDADALTWELGSPQYGAMASERGQIDMTRLRAAAAKFAALLSELRAKQANFRTRCTHSPQPIGDEE